MITRIEIEASYAALAAGILRPGTLLRGNYGTVEVFRSKPRGKIGDVGRYTLWVKHL